MFIDLASWPPDSRSSKTEVSPPCVDVAAICEVSDRAARHVISDSCDITVGREKYYYVLSIFPFDKSVENSLPHVPAEVGTSFNPFA